MWGAGESEATCSQWQSEADDGLAHEVIEDGPQVALSEGSLQGVVDQPFPIGVDELVQMGRQIDALRRFSFSPEGTTLSQPRVKRRERSERRRTLGWEDRISETKPRTGGPNAGAWKTACWPVRAAPLGLADGNRTASTVVPLPSLHPGLA
jgi:hypothetical protein